MDNDDVLIGQVLSRRDAVRLLSVTGAGVLLGCERPAPKVAAGGDSVVTPVRATQPDSVPLASRPNCIVRPELTVGPYFVDKQLDRSDIRIEPTTSTARAGVPLALTFAVSNVGGGACAPLAGAMVDVWQCDAAGEYSGVRDDRFDFDTVGQRFLRGYQVTDASGVARFTTIYPGWYEGRCVHIHFKIRTPADAVIAGRGATYEFTSQLFFDEAVTDRVHAREPYAAKGRRTTTNGDDGIYREAGDQLQLSLTEANQAYAASFAIGLDLSDAEVGRADSLGLPGGPGGPPPGGPPPRGGRRRPPSSE